MDPSWQISHYNRVEPQPTGPRKRAERAVPILSWLTPLGALVSVSNVAVSLCTGEWLKSMERIPIDSPNSTQKDEFQIKTTVSGLWTLCYVNNSKEAVVPPYKSSSGHNSGSEYHCFGIEYFAKDRYTPDPHDSTMAIPYAVTRAGPLFILAAMLLMVAIGAASMGHLSRARRVAMFVGGIIFIIAGLMMLVGLVVYLSVLQSEIGSKLRPRNSLEDPLFSYSYGYGFILVVVGFMSTEFTGISAIFWYMYWHQLDWARKAVSNSLTASANNLNHLDAESERITYDPPIGFDYRLRNSHQDNAYNGNKFGWRCDLHYPQESKACHSSSKLSKSKHHGRSEVNVQTHRMRDAGQYDFDFDLPLPPPPPLPRDATTITTVSGDGSFPNDDCEMLSNRCRKTTPV